MKRPKLSGNSNGRGKSRSRYGSAAKSSVTIYGFDTEDDSQGTPKLFGFVFGRGSYWTRERSVALEYLHRIGHENERRRKEEARLGIPRSDRSTVQVWATNLEYDLLNLFGVDRIAEVSLRWGRNFLVGARWQGIDFRDTFRHIPAGVEELGKLVGMPKLETDLFKDRSKITERQLVRRCMRDAGITFRTARELHSIYSKLGEKPKLTLASTARSLWQSQYFKREVYRPLDEIWEAAGAAYYGGRTEPFRIGTFGPLTVIDVASMFPWAMTAGDFPVPWGAFSRVKGAVNEVQPSGIYRVLAESDLPVPVLPHRTEQGLIYPNGKFRGWYVGEELEYFRSCGGSFRVIEGFEFFDSCDPFTSYVEDLFKRKQEARGPLRTVFKLLLNSLYGKFGQKGEKVLSIPLERFRALKKAPLDFRVWNGLAVYRIDGVPPPWGNNLWPAIVTARARIRLHREISRIVESGGRVFYCDTDSVMFDNSKLRYPKQVMTPGKFELRGRFKEIIIVGKKEYAIQGFDGRIELHAKGVPFLAREAYLRTGKASFQRPVRLLESTRSGATPNLWRTVSKERRVTYANRARRADGSLAPIKVRLED